MHIEVRPRYVAAPWEREQGRGEGRRCLVGFEADVTPEIGPLELYLSAWPHRRVYWHPEHQLFAIDQVNPISGHTELHELVFFWDAPPDPDTGKERSSEEIADLVDKRDASLIRRYLPFDYEFVQRRLRDRSDLQSLGARRRQRRIQDRNAAIAASKTRDFSRETAAFFGEIRRYMNVLEDGHIGARTPLVAGVDLPSRRTA